MYSNNRSIRKTKLWLASILCFVSWTSYAEDTQNNKFTFVIDGQITEELPIGYKYILHDEILLDSTTGKPAGTVSELLKPLPDAEKGRPGALYLVDSVKDEVYHLQNYSLVNPRYPGMHRWDNLGIGHLFFETNDLYDFEQEHGDVEFLVFNNPKNKVLGTLRDIGQRADISGGYSVSYVVYEIDGHWFKVADNAWLNTEEPYPFFYFTSWENSLVGTPDGGWPGHSILNQPLLIKNAAGQYIKPESPVTTEDKFIYLLQNEGNYGYVLATDEPIEQCMGGDVKLDGDKGWIRIFDDNMKPMLEFNGMMC